MTEALEDLVRREWEIIHTNFDEEAISRWRLKAAEFVHACRPDDREIEERLKRRARLERPAGDQLIGCA